MADSRDTNSLTGVDLYEELSRLNNELVDMQRELAKKNAALKKADEEKTRLLREDPLTRVANRRYFLERFNDLYSLARRHGRPLTVMMFDLDNFKSINDTYGHATGDTVLKAFSSLLKSSCRTEDLPARLGGEEFAMLLPETGIEGAFAAAERIRKGFAELDLLEDKRPCTVSIGVARLEPDDTYDTLMKKADSALYDSKNTGRNKTTVHE